MRTRLPLAVAAAVATALLAAGCAATPTRVAPVGAGSPPPSPAVASPTPLSTPSTAPGEVVRSTFGGGKVTDPAAPMPADGQLAVEVACSGYDGGTMSWMLESGDGRPLGLSGEADCAGPPTTAWLGITAERRPAQVRVRLLPTAGVVVGGWAIVRRGTP